jgi:hypothetical protein
VNEFLGWGMFSKNKMKSSFWQKFRPYVPLFVGLAAFALFLMSWQQDGITVRDSRLFPPTAFDGIKFVYAMFVGSIATTVYATFDYRNELREMSSLAEGSDGKSFVTAAKICLSAVISLIALSVVGLLLLPGVFGRPDPCDSESYQTFIHTHDFVVGIIFIAFVVSDRLTLIGMRKAREKIEYSINDLRSKISSIQDEVNQRESKNLRDMIDNNERDLVILQDKRASAIFAAEFSKFQLWIVDIPVLFGLFVIFLITQLALNDAGWNSAILKIDVSISEAMAQSRTINLLSCNGTGVSIYEFQKSISGIFSAGIAMGFVAASVIMSQIIFIALNIIYDGRMIEVDKRGPVDITSAIG